MKPFPGFPPKSRLVPVPVPFFTLLLSTIDDLQELKVTLYLLWLLSRKRGYLRFVSLGELLQDKLILGALGGGEKLLQALERAVNRGTFLALTLEKDGSKYHLYFLNSPEDKEAMGKLSEGEVVLGELVPEKEAPLPEKGDIFSLYEENIGVLTPLIAEELARAEKIYPYSWLEEAFREAALQNKRRWRYIQKILQRWASDGKTERNTEKEAAKKRYLGGTYGRVVRY